MARPIQAKAAVNPNPAKLPRNAKTDEQARYDFLFRPTNVGVQPNTLADKYAAQAAPSAMMAYQENLLIHGRSWFPVSGELPLACNTLNGFRAFMATGGGYLTRSPI
ncbi:MAG: hypothetical protein IPN20_04075 [Haliscomenobacter sp.]|nr:hypothetical protein [Haliscomenobacter sp.]